MWRIFPPKDLEKIRRPKYACANFLKKMYVCAGHISVVNKLNIYQLVVLLWYHYLFTNEKSVKLLSCNKHSINISSFISHFICFNSLWQVNFNKKLLRKNFVYILRLLRLLAGKSGRICTEFPLATFSAKILTTRPLKFPAMNFLNSISCKKNVESTPIIASLLVKKLFSF